MIRAAKTPIEIRREAARLARLWADEREATGDPEGAAEMRALASQIARIRLTKPWTRGAAEYASAAPDFYGRTAKENAMTVTYLADPAVKPAIERLIEIARSDTGQSARVANFLLAWWNGDDWGHFPISDLFGVDREIAADMTTVFGFLGQHPGAIYADAFGFRDAMADLVELWRAS